MGKKEDIEATLLRKLYVMGKIGGPHTPFDNLPKGFPPHVRGDVKKVAKELIKRGFLKPSRHNYGLGVSLNIEKLKEIEEILFRAFPELKKQIKS